MRINLRNFVQFTKQKQCRQYKATREIRPVGGQAHLKLWSQFSENPKQSKQTVNDGNNNNNA